MDTYYKKINNISIPSIGLGTFNLKGDECIKAVHDALDIGYRHIDTAQMYGNEDAIGHSLSKTNVAREDIWLTTKIWHTDLAPKNVVSSFEVSLQKLQTPYVDLLLIHWPSTTGASLKSTLETMAALKDEGKAKNIGVSNFPLDMYNEAKEITNIICNQVEYHPFLNQKKLWNALVTDSMFLTAYSPIAQGKVFKNELMNDIGEKYGKNAAQVSLRWLIQQDNVLAIPRSSSSINRKSNFEVYDFELTEEEMTAIFNLNNINERIVNPAFAPAW